MAGGDLGTGETTAAAKNAWICFEDEAGQGLRPPRGRAWGRRGHTPAVKVTAQGSKRVSIAALLCHRDGHRPRLIYRIIAHHGRKGEKKGFTATDYARLLDQAHQQLTGPIVLVWDNLNTHVSTAMKNLRVCLDLCGLGGGPGCWGGCLSGEDHL